MTSSVIVDGARTPIGRFRGPRPVHGRGARGLSRSARRSTGRASVPSSWTTSWGRSSSAEPVRRPPGRLRSPQDQRDAGAQRRQGVPVGHRRDRPGRPADPRGRGRDRGCGRHGVDDERPLPAAGGARGIASGRCHGRGLAHLRRPVVDVHPDDDGGGVGRGERGARHLARGAGRGRLGRTPARSRGGTRERSPRRSCASRCCSAAATRSWWRATRASGRTRPPRDSPP